MAGAGLEDWWLSAFDDAERAHILATFQPMGATDGGAALVEGNGGGSVADPSRLLHNLASWFKREADRTIGYRIIDKAEELLAASPSVLTKHFTYQIKAQLYYRWRGVDSFALERAEKACRDQIGIAPIAAEAFLQEDTIEGLGFLPSHHGYKQLAIILEKRGAYPDAVAFCEQAKEQGWKGDWDSRLARLEKKLAKGAA